MLPRVALASLLVALIAGPAFAQSPSPSQFGMIRGQVIEARTGAPLAAVLVQVQSTRQRAFSDADGTFEIADVPAGSQTLVVSVVGFGLVRRDVMVTSGQTSDLTIPVAGGASTYVEEVTVAASTFREAEPAVSSQSVLGSRELLALRGVIADDPFRAVQTLPGVTTGDDFKGEFAVRGLGPQHIGISVDGVDSPFLFHTVRAIDDTGSLALINSDILDQAVLLAGPHPQKLGSHLGARLDFTTRDGTRAGFAARTLISGSAATGLFEGPLGSEKKGSWLIAARRSYIDWLLERVQPDLDGSFGFTDVQGGVTYDLTPRQQIRVTFIGGRSLLHEREEFPSFNTLERGSSRTVIANARWRLTLSPKALLNQQLYVVRNRYENQVTDGRAREEGWDRDITWRGALDWRPATAHAFDIGAQAQSLRARRIDRRFTSATSQVVNVDAKRTTTNAAGYVSYRWSPSSSFVLSPGARVEHWQLVDATKVSPWLLADVQIAPNTRLRGGAGVQYQSPTVDHALFARAGDRLVPERALSTELGVERRFGGNWRVSAGAFYREDEDRLRIKSSDVRLVDNRLILPSRAYADNVLTGATKGAEITIERRSVNGLTGWVSYTYARSTVTDLSGTVTGAATSIVGPETYAADYDQRHTLNVYAGYRWSGRTSLSARFRYGSNFPIPGYFEPHRGEIYLIGTRRNTVRLTDYARLDLRADRTFTYRKRRLTLFVEVINVMNRDNMRPQVPSYSPNTREVWALSERVFPLLPSAGVLIEF